MREYYVYIMTNWTRTLYIGVTNDLVRRVYEHKQKFINGFTKKYNITFLEYYETTSSVEAARVREKPISDLAENVNFCLETFGEGRAYFAGDWPVCTLRASLSEWIGALKTIVSDRSVEFQRKLFHDNAVKFYGLTASN